MLPCVTPCYPVLACVTLFYPLLPCVTLFYPLLPCVTLCYPAFFCVFLCYHVLPFVTLCFPVLPCVTLCSLVLRFVTTVASQPLDRILLPWLVNPHSPAMTPHSRHASYWWNSGRKKNKGWEGGKTLNETLHRPLHKRSTKNSQILAVTKVPRTMWACTYGIDRWMPAKLVAAWPLSLWTFLTA